jgi:hypothetical protein
MAANETLVMTSHNLLNYAGMLFNRGNVRTPFSTMIGARQKITNSAEFLTSLSVTSQGGTTQPAITETASLTAPDKQFRTRTQAKNVCQIFMKALGQSYASQSNVGALAGLNLANQQANPQSEMDFQVGIAMTEIGRDIEYTFINGVYQLGGYDDVANKTRGMIPAITTNEIAAAGKGLGLWLVADAIKAVYDANAPTSGLVLLVDATTLFQLNADAKDNDLTIVPNSREVNGISISTLITPMGEIGIRLGECLPAGTVLIVNPSVCAPVHQPVPGKGNFFREPLAKTGAQDAEQIYGQLGLDYGAEWYHAKITGLSTSFTAPVSAKKVYMVSPAPTIEVDATLTDVTLDKATVVVAETATATPVLNIAPATAGTFAYEWQTSATATGTFAAASTFTGYNTAEVTAPAEVPAAKFLRCAVTSSGSVEAATLYSDVIEIVAAG